MSKRAFPQNFPPHLHADAPIAPVLGTDPLGRHILRFHAMHAPQFEQFCWWLVQRDYDITGCQLVGGNGNEQGGIDLFAYSRQDPARVLVFECKCWEDYRADKLKEAAKRFLAGPWAVPGTTYTLIIAQEEAGKLSKVWDDIRRQLGARGIASDMWTGIELTERVRLHPDILLRFFPTADALVYCNEWMRHVDFERQLQQALVDPRASVRERARHYVGAGDIDADDTLEQMHCGAGHCHIDTPWVHISVLLPHERRFSGSAAIVIKAPDTSGCSVALSQDLLLTRMLGPVGAPLLHEYRPFIVGAISDRPDAEITIALDSARLQLPPDGLRTMCRALDRLAPAYAQALQALERHWDADGFPFVGRGDATVVAICAVPARLWQFLLAFACAHDVEAGDSEWHIFQPNELALMPFTRASRRDFDPGYHGCIRARNDLPASTYGGDLVLTWEPPPSFGSFPLGPRDWMPCAHAFAWLRDRLVPAAGRWAAREELRRAWPWRRRPLEQELARQWTEMFPVSSLRQVPLLDEMPGDVQCRAGGLAAVLRALHAQLERGAPALWLDAAHMGRLYRAAAVLVRGGRGYPGHIASNLSLGNACRSHADVAAALEVRAAAVTAAPSTYGIKCLLSAMLDALGDDPWPDTVEAAAVRDALVPLMARYDLMRLYERHTRWA